MISNENSDLHGADATDESEYEAALREQAAAEARQPEIPHSSNADVVTLLLGAVMIIGLVVCMTIYM